MPRVQASILLPYLLKLKSGLYSRQLELEIHQRSWDLGRSERIADELADRHLGNDGYRAYALWSRFTIDQRDTEDPDEQATV